MSRLNKIKLEAPERPILPPPPPPPLFSLFTDKPYFFIPTSLNLNQEQLLYNSFISNYILKYNKKNSAIKIDNCEQISVDKLEYLFLNEKTRQKSIKTNKQQETVSNLVISTTKSVNNNLLLSTTSLISSTFIPKLTVLSRINNSNKLSLNSNQYFKRLIQNFQSNPLQFFIESLLLPLVFMFLLLVLIFCFVILKKFISSYYLNNHNNNNKKLKSHRHYSSAASSFIAGYGAGGSINSNSKTPNSSSPSSSSYINSTLVSSLDSFSIEELKKRFCLANSSDNHQQPNNYLQNEHNYNSFDYNYLYKQQQQQQIPQNDPKYYKLDSANLSTFGKLSQSNLMMKNYVNFFIADRNTNLNQELLLDSNNLNHALLLKLNSNSTNNNQQLAVEYSDLDNLNYMKSVNFQSLFNDNNNNKNQSESEQKNNFDTNFSTLSMNRVFPRTNPTIFRSKTDLSSNNVNSESVEKHRRRSMHDIEFFQSQFAINQLSIDNSQSHYMTDTCSKF